MMMDETLREIFLKAIAGKSQFQEAEKSGKAFVIPTPAVVRRRAVVRGIVARGGNQPK
jgi:hypothetical protein